PLGEGRLSQQGVSSLRLISKPPLMVVFEGHVPLSEYTTREHHAAIRLTASSKRKGTSPCQSSAAPPRGRPQGTHLLGRMRGYDVIGIAEITWGLSLCWVWRFRLLE